MSLAGICLGIAAPLLAGTPGAAVVRTEHVGLAARENIGDFDFPVCCSNDGRRVFIAYVTPEAETVVAMSPERPGGKWSAVIVDRRTRLDGWHNVPSIICDGEGYIHVWYDMHNEPWGYSRSNSPSTVADGFTDRSRELPGEKITYPRPWRDGRGRVYLTWRDRGRRHGGIGCLGIYDPEPGRWVATQIVFNQQEYTVGKIGVGVGPKGRLHTAAVWRLGNRNTGSAFGWDLTYAWSGDAGKTWRRTDGSACAVPVRHDDGDPDILVKKADYEHIRAQMAVPVDGRGRPHLVFQARQKKGIWHMLLQKGRWSPPSLVAADAAHPDAAIGPRDEVLVMTARGVFYLSLDGGATWRRHAPGYGHPVAEAKFDHHYFKLTGRLRLALLTYTGGRPHRDIVYAEVEIR